MRNCWTDFAGNVGPSWRCCDIAMFGPAFVAHFCSYNSVTLCRPTEAWICYEDQKLALLVAYQVHIARMQFGLSLWPQLANLIFPDRHDGSAQLRWKAAQSAAKIIANVVLTSSSTCCLSCIVYSPSGEACATKLLIAILAWVQLCFFLLLQSLHL